MIRHLWPKTWALMASFGFAVLVAASGCGGGGGGSSTNSNATNTTSTNAGLNRVEAVDVDGYVAFATSLRVGDTYQLRVWGRDNSGQVVVGAGTPFRTNAAANVATVAQDGTLVARGTGTFRVTAGNGAQGDFRTVASSGVVRGRLRNVEGQGVPEATVRFYDGGGNVVTTALTGSNGTFRVTVPASARTFLIDVGDLDGRYYNQFGFGSREYSTVCPQFRPALPERSGAQTVNLSDTAVVTRVVQGEPPPPPPDCVGP